MPHRLILAAIRLLYAPLMLAGFNGAALWLVEQNASHAWLLVLLLAALLLSFWAERLLPYEAAWNRGASACDLTHAFVNETATVLGVLAIPLLSGYSPWHSYWPQHWPLVWQWLLAVLVADCGITLMHWLSHRSALLWRFHAVHHAGTRFYGLNGLVKHPLHQLIETMAGTGPLLLIGLPQSVAGLLGFSVALQLLLQHSNVDMRLGPLRYLLALAPLHRFHHQRWAGIGDVNFGLFTTLWDRLLGTAVYDPQRRFVPGEFGIGTQPDYPRNYRAQLLAPFRPAASVSGAAVTAPGSPSRQTDA
ncbi:sterol desaturase family protein [Pseudoduganella sp. FT93W]|uniref:Sterol desaturase family protein n=1 Tax=Duganella fentianensis TaxID=2692177 RepID=A0A845I3A3_9BURK|nr:sterol desaturase family protein [Duganella fentianensis]MYN45616.1 sterol desaturase family protein [Duganella fentianensis]